VRLEGLGQLKKSTSLGHKAVALNLKRLAYSTLQYLIETFFGLRVFMRLKGTQPYVKI
jgi:hypothetical protein